MKGISQVKNTGIATIKGFQADSLNLSPNKDFEKRINLNRIKDSRNEIEIRFYEREEISNTTTLKILSKRRNKWTGTQYSESNYPKINIQKLPLEAAKGFEELFQSLLQKNLTRLPSQSELRAKMKKYGSTDTKRGRAEELLFVNDGYSYSLEFIINGKSNIITFSNPEIYANFYSDVQELKDYVAIKNIFNSELKKK
ncbi:hypothetical protein GCM10023183_15380 [Nibribacter koreensis]|uniref:DUF3298 domain-containing protein n=2 Tax=Nibribacter koreensis TaxID=1084519 RepID=A0ABP8FGE3_9BACT